MTLTLIMFAVLAVCSILTGMAFGLTTGLSDVKHELRRIAEALEAKGKP